MKNPLEADGEFQLSLMNPNPSFRTRKNSDHYFIDFEVSKDEWEWFTDPNIDRTGMVLELAGMVTHRSQINLAAKDNNDHKDVNTHCAEKISKTTTLTQEAGKICTYPIFQTYLRTIYPTYWFSSDEFTSDEERAAFCIRNICQMLSRKELESSETKRKLFMELMRDYRSWNIEK